MLKRQQERPEFGKRAPPSKDVTVRREIGRLHAKLDTLDRARPRDVVALIVILARLNKLEKLLEITPCPDQ